MGGVGGGGGRCSGRSTATQWSVIAVVPVVVWMVIGSGSDGCSSGRFAVMVMLGSLVM